MIRKGQESGQFGNRSDPRLLFGDVRNILIGISAQWCIAGGSYDVRSAIRESIISLLIVEQNLL